MNRFKQGWFTEADHIFPGFCPSLEVEEVLVDEKSKYQHILVFKTKRFGRVLVLDNAIQCTEFDEFSYQELIAFLPLNSHKSPKQVLIIGGGDGGVAREVLKHPSVQAVYQCEIDQRVIEVSKEHLPFMSSGFADPRLRVHIGDGHLFMAGHVDTFDVIITDSSDPIGPAESLFQEDYYKAMKKALKPTGVICCQCESMWFNLEMIKKMFGFCRRLFPVVAYAYTTIPSYPGGHIGFILCSMDPVREPPDDYPCLEGDGFVTEMNKLATRFPCPAIEFGEEDLMNLGLRYYNRRIHEAAFVLPQFVLKALQEGDVNSNDKNS